MVGSHAAIEKEREKYIEYLKEGWMTLLNVTYCENSEYESDLCSNEYYLNCSEIKA